ncbi:5199_t:CDS:2 [Paraglomus brasilianum]|uniref:5199_t:CDS:1 n=1 Tax=Paraglomus brasilianum TaxID=144538 RepID=A0A9N9C957_9GLOM|nr:5199_t:CDS:2 [Paraglomus brasilianum]
MSKVLHDQTIHSTPDFDSDSDPSLGSLETLSSSGLESLAAETFEIVKLSPKVSMPTLNPTVSRSSIILEANGHRRGKRVRDDKSYSNNRRASTRASHVNALESTSKRRSKRIRTGRRKLAQINAGPKQALTLAEKIYDEWIPTNSQRIIHSHIIGGIEQVVAELKWTLKAIKDTIGLTPKYMRSPFGDTDNRVRAIIKAVGLKSKYPIDM